MSECLSIVMPAYNEEATLETVVQRVLKVPHLLELVIVNDCSSDATGRMTIASRFDRSRNWSARSLRHSVSGMGGLPLRVPIPPRNRRGGKGRG